MTYKIKTSQGGYILLDVAAGILFYEAQPALVAVVDNSADEEFLIDCFSKRRAAAITDWLLENQQSSISAK